MVARVLPAKSGPGKAQFRMDEVFTWVKLLEARNLGPRSGFAVYATGCDDSPMKIFPALIAASACLAASPALAQGGPPKAGDTVTVGLGVGVTTDYDGADEYKLIPGGVLQGTVGGHDFRLNGLQLFVDAIPNDPARSVELELGPVAGLRFNRSGGVKDPQVAALGKLDEAVELGLAGSVGLRGVGSRTGTLSLGTSMVWDVAGAHGSWRLNPSLGYSTLVGRRTFVRAALTATIAPDAYAEYYFGVTPAGALASGLAPFDPDGGLESLGANVLATHSLSGGRTGWSLFGIASYSRLQGDFARSPIVRDAGSADQVFASVGVGYTF